MPYVNVKITRDGVTAEQKAQIVAEITATLQRVLGKRPEHTHIVIDEIDPENWGFAGMLTTEYRRQAANNSPTTSDCGSDPQNPLS
ncbi:tautomerase family protein [Tuwongella immobilis]|uniref:Tautomerase n=1 Tax=Tuwongella immobilis TaxID=692036 RepID=A0A6C2YKF4_9BACT|nr:4-oxalocrotonate tautomerase family protein [Tuwongella immobilis]VIP02060.1 4-oxalocrotonate tautomerase : 4-oxalocrotonate tautomerase OS=Pseudomonas resinovorans NBRC 106553 GN=dmpI PE=4 SV=1: Tautomerase [Tuwongella immobilis]VTS00267.1 4-oxalocrotonate tautomerase : 4-oxalocrotonate tautomerase OS=Pseudomonas resinovorans NBRC 106553 GN=dmpI PE=4 SV=1: Tautomerase [Tuwongella immobilis]